MTQEWRQPISVKIWMDRFRIGGTSQEDSIDLPVLKDLASEDSWYNIGIVSGFRGVLRRATRLLIAQKSFQKYRSIDASLFGSELGASQEMEGKLKFQLEPNTSKNVHISTNYGIRINPQFGSVEPNALFNYETVEGDICIEIKIRPLIPLTKDESIILLGALRLLSYDCLGGFTSKGFGLITKIIIEDTFTQFADSFLLGIIEGNNS